MLLDVKGATEQGLRVVDDTPGQVTSNRIHGLVNRHALANEIDVHLLKNLDAQRWNFSSMP
jgi:hypothetical protein